MTKVKQLSKMIGTLALATMFVVFGMFAFAGCEKKTTAKEIQDFVSAESTNNSFAIDTSAEGFAGAGVAGEMTITSSADEKVYKGTVIYKTYTDKDGKVTSEVIEKTDGKVTKEIYVIGDLAYTRSNGEGKYTKTSATEVASTISFDTSIVAQFMGDVEEVITASISKVEKMDGAKFTYSKSGKNTTYKMSGTLSDGTKSDKSEMTIVYNGNTINKWTMKASSGDFTVERLTSAPSVPTFNSDNTVE